MRWLVFTVAAVIACAAALGVVQYRSLVQLESRTRIAFQDDLVRSAHAVAGTLVDQLRTVGSGALTSFQANDTGRAPRELAARFAALHRDNPQLDEIFLFALDGPDGIAALFSTRNGLDRCT